MRASLKTGSLVLLVLALLAAPAGAGQSKVPGQAAEKTTVTGPIGAVRTVMVTCPRRTTAIWGGWRTGKVGPTTGALGIFESRRAGPRQWRVSAQVVQAAGSHPLQVLAFCSRGAPLRVAAQTSQLTLTGSGDAVGGSATCPSHMRAVSGGFHFSPRLDTTSFVSGSYRVRRRSWRTEVRGPAGAATRLTSTAYCGRGASPVARRGSVRLRPDPFTIGGEGTPPCPRLRSPLSGGFRFIPDAPTDKPLIPTALSRFETDVEAGFLVFSDVTVNVFSYCR
jgi:hypothetical protein